jgi:hypothetical protein
MKLLPAPTHVTSWGRWWIVGKHGAASELIGAVGSQ